MNKSRIELLIRNIRYLSFIVKTLSIVYLLFIFVPSYYYILFEDSLNVFYENVSTNPENAISMIDQICKNLMYYTIAFSISILMMSITIFLITYYSGKILEIFGWKTSKKIFHLIGFTLLAISTTLAILNLALYPTISSDIQMYLLEYATSGEEPSLPQKSLLYVIVSGLVQVNYFLIGVSMIILFTTLDAFSGQIGLFKQAKIGFKFLSIGALIYIIEMFVGMPISIIIIPIAALITSKKLRKIQSKIEKYRRKKQK